MGRMSPRRAAQRDANEAEIVAALRKAGATVYLLDKPCDLAVGKNKKNLLMEVKQPGKRLNPKQQEFCDSWEGQFAVVHTVREALELIGAVSPNRGLARD